MTATAIGTVTETHDVGYAAAALTLAALSGAMLLAMGLLRLGFVANFLSHPVISGFITASGLLIAASQVKHVLGISAEGHTLVELLSSLFAHIGETDSATLGIGAAALTFLFWVRSGMRPMLVRVGLRPGAADFVAKAGPVMV